MRELRYGDQMQDYTYSTGYQIKWTFPENVHIIKDTLYEIEYQVTKDYRQCVYKVTHIKSVSALVERINYIVNTFNKINSADSFEKWLNERYKLLVVK